jgi:hypothetical protein
MMTIFAQLIHASTDNAFSLLLSANNKTARPFLAMLTLENASMQISAVMTKTLVHLTLAISILVSVLTLLLLALMETNAQRNLVTLLKDANTLL